MPHNLERSRVNRATVSLMSTFLLLGAALSTWVSRLPAVRDAMEMQPSEMGTMLLVGSLGSLVALPISAPMVMRFGSSRVIKLGSVLWACGLFGAGLSMAVTSRPLLLFSLTVFTFGFSFWAASNNTEGGFLEAARRRAIQDKLHGCFSIGMVLGSSLAAVVISAGVSASMHLYVAAGLGVVLTWAASFGFLPREFAESYTIGEAGKRDVRGRTKKAWSEKRTILIAVMVLGAGLMEGSANDWLPLSMIDGYGVSESDGALFLTLFLVGMTVVRFSSAPLRKRLSPTVLMRILYTFAIVGLLMVASETSVLVAGIGIVLWAIGAALTFPSAATALSHDPAMTAARMSVLSTINWTSALIGPPILGIVAEHIGYARTMGVLVIPVAVAFVLAGQLDKPGEPEGASQTLPEMEN